MSEQTPDQVTNFPHEFPVTVSEIPDTSFLVHPRSPWVLCSGTAGALKDPVSIFTCDTQHNASESELELARKALKRTWELKDPSLLKVVQVIETESSVVVVTEKVSNLKEKLADLGLVDIARGLLQISCLNSFLHCDAKVRHNNIHLASVFVAGNGDWKLGGLEYSLGVGEETSPTLPGLPLKYNPPEENAEPLESQGIPPWGRDTWGFGCLIWEIFNQESSNLNLGFLQNIPHFLQVVFRKCLAKNPMKRPSPGELLILCQELSPSPVIPHSPLPTSQLSPSPPSKTPNTDVAAASSSLPLIIPLPLNEDFSDSVKTFVCPLCSKGYVQRQSLKRHVEKDHQCTLDVLLPKKKFKCTMCIKSFSHMHCLNRHIMKSHSDSKVSEE